MTACHGNPRRTLQQKASPMTDELTSPGPATIRRRGAGTLLGVTSSFVFSFLAVGALVFQHSSAAFTDTTDSTASALGAGTVVLSDDDSASALFNVSAMVPGQTEVECIEVTYSGTIADPAGVKLYSAGYVDSDDLASHLLLTIEEGTGGSFGDCTGFTPAYSIESGGTLADFDAAHTDYATGAGGWDPSATPVTRTYRVTFQLSPTVPDSQQGDTVTSLGLTWEVQS